MEQTVDNIFGWGSNGTQQNNRREEGILRPDSLQQSQLGTQSSTDTTRNEGTVKTDIRATTTVYTSLRPGGTTKQGEQRGKPGEQVSGAGLPPNQPKL